MKVIRTFTNVTSEENITLVNVRNITFISHNHPLSLWTKLQRKNTSTAAIS